MTIKKVKILQTIRQGKVGGGETHMLDLVSALDKEKYESVVLSFTEGPMVDKMRETGIKTYVIPTIKPFDSSINGEVQEILEAEKIDLIHAHGTRANSNVYKSAGMLSIPIVYTVHGWSFHKDQNFVMRNLRMLGERFLVKKSTVTICVSDSNLEEGKGFFKMGRAVVIKNGVNQNRFNPQAEYSNLRGDLGIKEDEILVGLIARITKQKDPLTFINAIALLRDSPRIKFLIVGDGDMLDKVKGLADKLNINDKIIFLNFRDDVPNVLNALDIYCLPSLWEGLPIGILEAMAMKKAIIATHIDATKELVTNMISGILIPLHSPAALAEAITKLASDGELRRQLGKEAGDVVDRKFNIRNMTEEVEKIYDSIMMEKNVSL